MDVEVLEYLEPGHWFVSIYNDDGDSQEVSCVVSVARDMARSCPRGCHDNGECVHGRCQCKSGYAGDDCSQSKFMAVFRITVLVNLIAVSCVLIMRFDSSSK